MRSRLHQSLFTFEERLNELLISRNEHYQLHLANELVSIEQEIQTQLDDLIARRAHSIKLSMSQSLLVRALNVSTQLHELLDTSERRFPDRNGST